MTLALILSVCALALSVWSLISLRRAGKQLERARENLRVMAEALGLPPSGSIEPPEPWPRR